MVKWKVSRLERNNVVKLMISPIVYMTGTQLFICNQSYILGLLGPDDKI